MRQAYIQEGFSLADLRIDRLERTKKYYLKIEISADFGHRNDFQGLATDILASVVLLDDAKQQL